MSEVIKLLSNSEVLGTANSTVSNARLVRLLSTSSVLVTLSDPVSDTVVGSLVLAANRPVALEKHPSEVLSSNELGELFCLRHSLY